MVPGASAAARPGPLSRWIPVVVWAALISVFSTESFGGNETGKILLPLLHLLLPGVAPDTIEAIHLGIRKIAHPTEYAILAILVQRAFAAPGRSFARVAVITLVICACYAGLDELHQMLVPNRVAAVRDVLLDSAGAAVGLVLVAVLRRAAPVSAGRRLTA